MEGSREPTNLLYFRNPFPPRPVQNIYRVPRTLFFFFFDAATLAFPRSQATRGTRFSKKARLLEFPLPTHERP